MNKTTIYEKGDYIEFKNFTSSLINNEILRGRIIDNSDPELLLVQQIRTPDNTCYYPDHYSSQYTSQFPGYVSSFGSQFPNSVSCNFLDNEILEENIWISTSSVTKHYSSAVIKRLTPRLLLKEKWKNFIFREVKTAKSRDQFSVTYNYLNESGFVRYERFAGLLEAQRVVPYELSKNIQIHYKDYFGFTTDQIIRNNDIYSNQEIFFSKKCYSELNLNGEVITGEFTGRRGFKTIPPKPKQYICGLVENGEKGLFYRKWFICSQEFLTLWTMICESDHFSLKTKRNGNLVTKNLSEILKELDTSHYNPENNSDSKTDNKTEGKENEEFPNVENYALYIPDLYQKIARAVFENDCLTGPKKASDDPYDYSTKFRNDIMWFL